MSQRRQRASPIGRLFPVARLRTRHGGVAPRPATQVLADPLAHGCAVQPEWLLQLRLAGWACQKGLPKISREWRAGSAWISFVGNPTRTMVENYYLKRPKHKYRRR